MILQNTQMYTESKWAAVQYSMNKLDKMNQGMKL